MKELPKMRTIGAMSAVLGALVNVCLAHSQERGQTSYMPVDIKESFASIMSRMTAAKPGNRDRAHRPAQRALRPAA
jgi:hypothetical protein